MNFDSCHSPSRSHLDNLDSFIRVLQYLKFIREFKFLVLKGLLLFEFESPKSDQFNSTVILEVCSDINITFNGSMSSFTINCVVFFFVRSSHYKYEYV